MSIQKKQFGKSQTRLTRRGFIAGGSVLLASLPLAAGRIRFGKGRGFSPRQRQGFKLGYAPSLGMFKHHAGDNPIDHLQFIADEGFGAFFDNGFMNRPPEQQDAIARAADHLGLVPGPFVAYADFSVKSFVTRDPDVRDMLKKTMRKVVETAKRAQAKWALVVPGRFDEGLEWDYQTANVVDNLKFCAEICEPSGLVMVLEPLNAWRNHPGLFLTKIPQAYMICRAVNSPSCKIINDIYHQQISEGNLIPNIEYAWDEIAAFHLGDNPGRNEPTTGEINYRNIFHTIYQKNYEGVLCMEHGISRPGKEGERAVIDAYRFCDDFPAGKVPATVGDHPRGEKQ